MDLPDLYPLIHEFGSRLNLNINTSWRRSIEKNDQNIISDAFLKYPTRHILGIDRPIKDIYDIVRAALDQDDIYTIRTLMHTYTGFLPIEWEHLTPYVRSREMAKLFQKGGYEDRLISSTLDSDIGHILSLTRHQYDMVLLESLIGSGIIFKGVDTISEGSTLDKVIECFMSICDPDCIYLSENIPDKKRLFLLLDKYGYIDKDDVYAYYKGFLYDDPEWIGEYSSINLYNYAFIFDSYNIYLKFKEMGIIGENEIKENILDATGRILLDILKDKEMAIYALDRIYDQARGPGYMNIDYIDLILSMYPDLISKYSKSIIYSASKDRYLHLLDRYMLPNQGIKVAILSMKLDKVPHVSMDIYRILESKGIKWKWIAYYLEVPFHTGNEESIQKWRERNHIENPSPLMWKKIVATILGDELLEYVEYVWKLLDRIILSHRKDITPEILLRMKSLYPGIGSRVEYILSK